MSIKKQLIKKVNGQLTNESTIKITYNEITRLFSYHIAVDQNLIITHVVIYLQGNPLPFQNNCMHKLI